MWNYMNSASWDTWLKLEEIPFTCQRKGWNRSFYGENYFWSNQRRWKSRKDQGNTFKGTCRILGWLKLHEYPSVANEHFTYGLLIMNFMLILLHLVVCFRATFEVKILMHYNIIFVSVTRDRLNKLEQNSRSSRDLRYVHYNYS